MNFQERAKWILRVGVAGEFIGHGFFALLIKESWIPYLTAFGFSVEQAPALLQLIGAMDIIVGATILLYPSRFLLIWATIWGALTGFIRPLTGGSWFDFIERWANWAAPLALYLLSLEKPKREI